MLTRYTKQGTMAQTPRVRGNPNRELPCCPYTLNGVLCGRGFAETLQDGVHGFLVEPGNVESLAQALTRLLSDDELRARMASAVERLAGEELLWSNIAKQTVRLYQTLVEAKKETRER